MKKILALDIKYSAIQALYFGSFCALMGYASVYLLNKGFSNSVIGIVLALISAIAVFAQPTVASFADKNKHIELRKIIAVMLLVIIVLSVSMLFLGKGSIILICAFIGISTCMQTMTPLLNSMAFMFEKHGIAINFGLGRGIGSAAYALVSLALGHLLEMDGFGADMIPLVYIVFNILLLFIVYSFVVPKNEQQNIQNDNQIEEEQKQLSFIEFCQKYFLSFKMTVISILEPS